MTLQLFVEELFVLIQGLLQDAGPLLFALLLGWLGMG